MLCRNKKKQQQNIAFVSWDRNKTILFHHLSTFTFRKFLKVFDCLFSLHTAFHFRRNQLVQLDINYRFLQGEAVLSYYSTVIAAKKYRICR